MTSAPAASAVVLWDKTPDPDRRRIDTKPRAPAYPNRLRCRTGKHAAHFLVRPLGIIKEQMSKPVINIFPEHDAPTSTGRKGQGEGLDSDPEPCICLRIRILTHGKIIPRSPCTAAHGIAALTTG